MCLIIPKETKNNIINGNKTKNQEMDLYPLLHNQPSTNVHKNAKINLLNTTKTGILLNNIIIQLSTEKAKYSFAGVHSLLKSVFII